VAKIIQNKETKYWPHKSHKPTATTTSKKEQAEKAMTARHPVLYCNIPQIYNLLKFTGAIGGLLYMLFTIIPFLRNLQDK